MKPKGTQEPATVPYPEPEESISHHIFFKIHLNIFPPSV